MAAKISEAQARVLRNFQSGIYERGIFHRGDGWTSLGGRASQSAESLVRLGLLEQQPGNAVWRITDAGRAYRLPGPTYHSDQLGTVTIPEE